MSEADNCPDVEAERPLNYATVDDIEGYPIEPTKGEWDDGFLTYLRSDFCKDHEGRLSAMQFSVKIMKEALKEVSLKGDGSSATAKKNFPNMAKVSYGIKMLELELRKEEMR